MADYIDRENYCKSICRCSRDKCDKDKCPLWAAPAATVREDVQGQWLREPSDIGAVDIERCSVCGCEMNERNQFWNANFCPSCGADMRKR